MKKYLSFVFVLLLSLSFNLQSFWNETCKESIGKKYDYIYYIEYSPDWKSYVYEAELYWKRFIVKDWIEWKRYDYIYYIEYSPDWKSFTYEARLDWKRFIVKDWKEWKKYDFVIDIKYSPDWKSFSYRAKLDWKRFIVKDWIEWKRYDDIWYIKYSPDWKSYVYGAELDWKWFIVQNICWNNEINKNLKSKKIAFKQAIISKRKILKDERLSKFLSKLDLFVEKYSWDKEKLEKIYIKIWKLKWNTKRPELELFLDYLEAKILIKIWEYK